MAWLMLAAAAQIELDMALEDHMVAQMDPDHDAIVEAADAAAVWPPVPTWAERSARFDTGQTGCTEMDGPTFA